MQIQLFLVNILQRQSLIFQRAMWKHEIIHKSKYHTHMKSSEPPCVSSPPLVGETEMDVTCLLEYSGCRTKQCQQLGHRSLSQYNVFITSCYSPHSPKSPSSNMKEWIQSYYTHTYTHTRFCLHSILHFHPRHHLRSPELTHLDKSGRMCSGLTLTLAVNADKA